MAGSPVIHPGSLTVQRMLSDDSLNASAAIQVATNTPDGRGGFTKSFTTAATLPCRIGLPRATPERSVAGRIEDASRAYIIFAAGTVLAPDTRIIATWDENGTPRQVTLSIIARDDLRSNASRSRYLVEAVR